MKKIKELISFCYGNDVVRYVFFGGCTTLVNLVCFYILWNLCHLNLNIANVISKTLLEIIKGEKELV